MGGQAQHLAGLLDRNIEEAREDAKQIGAWQGRHWWLLCLVFDEKACVRAKQCFFSLLPVETNSNQCSPFITIGDPPGPSQPISFRVNLAGDCACELASPARSRT